MTLFKRRVVLRVWYSGLLVIAAIGGAGLAVAADRPQNPVQRPELTWRADVAAAPHIRALADDLALLQADVADLSRSGREALARLLADDQSGLAAALEAGDRASVGIAAAADELEAQRSRTDAEIERWRLGLTTRATLEQLDAAIESGAQLPALWAGLAAAARTGGEAAVGAITDALEAIEFAGGRISDAADGLNGAA
jgi:hypothetical protein